MTWLYVPSTSSVSAPEQPDSISDSDWRFRLLERFATSSGKPMPAKSWYRAYRTKPWMTRLFGRILEPSTANRGVEQWISSLRATRASHSALPVSDWEKMTSVIFGRMLPALSTRFSRRSSSSRTSQTTFDLGFDLSEMTYDAWATALQQDCTRRLRRARLMSAGGSLSWPTPNVPNGGRMVPQEVVEAKGNMPERKHQIDLAAVARYWPTPDASVSTGYNQSPSPGAAVRPHLGALAPQWQTPRSHESGQYQFDPKMGVNKLTLDGQAQQWATPEATSGSNGGPNSTDSSGRPKLAGQAARWGFPTVRDHKDTSGQSLPVNGLLGRQALTTETDGSDTSSDGRVLNPQFVEALMGWPIGWTDCDIALIGFDSWVMGWSRWLLH